MVVGRCWNFVKIERENWKLSSILHNLSITLKIFHKPNMRREIHTIEFRYFLLQRVKEMFACIQSSKATKIICHNKNEKTQHMITRWPDWLPSIPFSCLPFLHNHQLSWTYQVNALIDKGKKMNSALKFVRSRLTYNQFIIVLTSQLFGVCFNGCNVWLTGQNSYHDVRKLNALHYRSLQSAVMDYRRKLKRYQLDKIGHEQPSTWAKYSEANLVIKTFTRNSPKRLYEDLLKTSYRKEENLEGQCSST